MNKKKRKSCAKYLKKYIQIKKTVKYVGKILLFYYVSNKNIIY